MTFENIVKNPLCSTLLCSTLLYPTLTEHRVQTRECTVQSTDYSVAYIRSQMSKISPQRPSFMQKYVHLNIRCACLRQKWRSRGHGRSKSLPGDPKVTSKSTQSDSGCSQSEPKGSQVVPKGSPRASKNVQKRGPKPPWEIF